VFPCSNYLFLIVEEGGERELASIEASDTIFANRVLVAIDDAGPPRGNGPDI
jgi:hypothetical protein